MDHRQDPTSNTNINIVNWIWSTDHGQNTTNANNITWAVIWMVEIISDVVQQQAHRFWSFLPLLCSSQMHHKDGILRKWVIKSLFQMASSHWSLSNELRQPRCMGLTAHEDHRAHFRKWAQWAADANSFTGSAWYLVFRWSVHNARLCLFLYEDPTVHSPACLTLANISPGFIQLWPANAMQGTGFVLCLWGPSFGPIYFISCT